MILTTGASNGKVGSNGIWGNLNVGTIYIYNSCFTESVGLETGTYEDNPRIAN
jgi:hypothetical protein